MRAVGKATTKAGTAKAPPQRRTSRRRASSRTPVRTARAAPIPTSYSSPRSVSALAADLGGILRAHTRGDSRQAGTLTPDFIDRFAIAGPPDHCIARLRELAAESLATAAAGPG